MRASRYAVALCVALTLVVAAALVAMRLGESRSSSSDGTGQSLPRADSVPRGSVPSARGERSALERPARASEPSADIEVARDDGSRADPSRGEGELHVRVLDPEGTALSFAHAELIGRERVFQSVEQGVDPLRFTGLPPGRYRLRVEADGGEVLASPLGVELRDREVRVLEFVVPRADRVVAGRVLDGDGVGLVGLRVEAEPYLAAPAANRLLPLDLSPAVATTGFEGRFQLVDLVDLEHELRVESPGGGVLESRIVRAGSTSLEIVLRPLFMVRVHGAVRDEAGQPLAGAAVTPLGAPLLSVRTGPDGRYEIFLGSGADPEVQTLAISHEGHRTEQVHLRHESLAGREEHLLDVVLRPIGETAAFAGRLGDAEGRPIAGETVLLQSASQRLRTSARSDAEGIFTLGEVPLANDYRLWVHPGGGFEDLVEESIEVGGEGVFVELYLEPLGSAPLTGRVVDTAGRGRSGLALTVRSARALARAKSFIAGAGGAFALDAVPAGELIFETRASPHFTVRGIELESGAAREVELVVDQGGASLGGEVVDAEGVPVAVARIDLYWNHDTGSGRSSSYRSTSSDRSGIFDFTELGSGEHKLVIDAPGFRRSREVISLAEDSRETLRVVLERAAGK